MGRPQLPNGTPSQTGSAQPTNRTASLQKKTDLMAKECSKMDGVHTMESKEAARTGHPSAYQVKKVLKELKES
jgi:hypothetical protein